MPKQRDRTMEILAREINRWAGSSHSFEGIKLTVKFLGINYKVEQFEDFSVHDGAYGRIGNPIERRWMNITALLSNGRADALTYCTLPDVPAPDHGGLARSLEVSVADSLKIMADLWMDQVKTLKNERIKKSGLSREPRGIRYYGETPRLTSSKLHPVIELMEAASARVKGCQPYVLKSGGIGFLVNSTTRVVNSEDTRVRTSRLRGGAGLVALIEKPTGERFTVESPRVYLDLQTKQISGEVDRITKKLIRDLPGFRTSIDIPPADYPVLLNSGFASVYVHEMLAGHMLSAEDYAKEGSEAIKGMDNRIVISPQISLIADPTLPGRFGSYEFDEEGVRGRRTVLIEKGVLKDFHTDRCSAFMLSQLRGTEVLSNGHCRIGDYNDIIERKKKDEDKEFSGEEFSLTPSPRQSNIIVEASGRVSRAELEEMLMLLARERGLEWGLIAEDFKEGAVWQKAGWIILYPYKVTAVHVKTGERRVVFLPYFQCHVQNAFSPEHIVGVGYGDSWHNGSCGASSGFVPVSTRAPRILVNSLTLGCETTSKHTQRWQPNGSS